MEEYALLVRLCLDAGFTIQFVPDGQQFLATAQATKPDDWGFHAVELQVEEHAITWPENDLITFLTFSGYDYSSKTPPVSWFAPHSVSGYDQWQAFAEIVTKEIIFGWMNGSYDFMPTVRF